MTQATDPRFVQAPSGCWIWLGYVAPSGYGRGWSTDRKEAAVWAHRLIYETLVGPIPEGLTIDHLCRVRRCVNPLHLDVVTMRVNVLRGDNPAARNARKTHCKYGHLLPKEPQRRGRRLARTCRECHSRRQRERRYRRRQLAHAGR